MLALEIVNVARRGAEAATSALSPPPRFLPWQFYIVKVLPQNPLVPEGPFDINVKPVSLVWRWLWAGHPASPCPGFGPSEAHPGPSTASSSAVPMHWPALQERAWPTASPPQFSLLLIYHIWHFYFLFSAGQACELRFQWFWKGAEILRLFIGLG